MIKLAELPGFVWDVFKNLDRKVFLRIVVGDQAGLPCKIEIPAFVKCRNRDKDQESTMTLWLQARGQLQLQTQVQNTTFAGLIQNFLLSTLAKDEIWRLLNGLVTQIWYEAEYY